MPEEHLVFTIDRDFYAVHASAVEEIQEAPDSRIRRVPGSARETAGLFGLGDRAIAVVDLRAILTGRSTEPSPTSSILVCAAPPSEGRFGLLVDSIIRMEALTETEGETGALPDGTSLRLLDPLVVYQRLLDEQP